MARLESVQSFQRLEEGILDKVVCVAQSTRPSGQSASGETLQRFEVAGEKALDRRVVALPRPGKKLDGRFDRSLRR